MTKFKKLLSAALMLGALASCGETPTVQPTQQPTETQQPSQAPESTPEVSTPEVESTPATSSDLVDAALAGIANNKTVYLTTVGQADSNIVENVLKKAGAVGSYELDAMLNASEVTEGSVVILTLGSSSKGLGSAGVDEAHEKARAQAFSAAAAQGKFTLILFHVGGTPRRGASSDPIIEAAFPGAKACFIVASGNEDGFFTNLSTTNDVTLYSVAKTLDLVDYAKALFGL